MYHREEQHFDCMFWLHSSCEVCWCCLCVWLTILCELVVCMLFCIDKTKESKIWEKGQSEHLVFYLNFLYVAFRCWIFFFFSVGFCGFCALSTVKSCNFCNYCIETFGVTFIINRFTFKLIKESFAHSTFKQNDQKHIEKYKET